jgi:peptidoglycan/LPS O-acetylase OafA/YrhL
MPPAIGVAAWIAWYWMRLGRDSVPSSRRRIRRISLVLMLMLLSMLVGGLSIVDRQVEPNRYIIVWILALVVILMIVATAGLDAVNTMRLIQRQAHEAIAESARDLSAAIAARRREQRGGQSQERQT